MNEDPLPQLSALACFPFFTDDECRSSFSMRITEDDRCSLFLPHVAPHVSLALLVSLAPLASVALVSLALLVSVALLASVAPLVSLAVDEDCSPPLLH